MVAGSEFHSLEVIGGHSDKRVDESAGVERLLSNLTAKGGAERSKTITFLSLEFIYFIQ